MKLPDELVIGTWGVVRSEIPPPHEAGKEFFHFLPYGTHCWEYPFIEQKRKIWRFRFRMTDSGVHITRRIQAANAIGGGELKMACGVR
jgi:hypothetical protein